MPSGRIRSFDREDALVTAMQLFWRKGYNATSLRDLAESLGLSMPSLYSAFGSKEKLFVDVVNLYMKIARDSLWAEMNGLPAREAVRMVLLVTARELANSGAHPAGCLVTVAHVDEDMPQPVAHAIRQARKDWFEMIQMRLKAAISDSTLPPDTNVDGLSRFYSGIVQMVAVQAHDGASAENLEELVNFAMEAWPK